MTPSRSSALAREYGPLLLAYLATRIGLYAAGLRFKLDLSWMFLSDLEALEHRLLETVYYFHAFAPGMNIITGVLLAISREHVLALATGLFWTCGALLTASVYRLLVTLGSSRWASLALALAFALLPQTLFLENLYLYTYLCAGLLCAAAVLFHRALQRGSAGTWFWFFLVCAALGGLYTVFHLLWFALMVGLAVLIQTRTAPSTGRPWRPVLLGAAFPVALLFGVYAKNFALFGVFGATSWGPSNMTLATTQQMRPAEREQWIREGKLSPFAAINVYSPPSAYLGLLPPGVHYPWPGSNELVRPSVGQGNYNHGLFLAVNAARQRDVAYFLANRPMAYVRGVLGRNLPGLFHSTTHWHPQDRRPSSPHHEHRRVLGRWENLYDRLVHSWPLPRVGLFVFLPLFLAWAVWSSLLRLRADDRNVRAAGALLGFCVIQILFVVSASSLFTAWETSRYRYAIEPCIWVVVALALREAYPHLKRWVFPFRRVPAEIASDAPRDVSAH